VDRRERVLEEIYRRRYLAFRNALTPIAGSREAARDAVQEAFAKALRARKQLRSIESIEAWVWRIALRAALDGRRNGRELSLDEAVAEVDLVEPAQDRQLAHALRRLSPRRRLIVFLRYYADLPYSEIAAICDVSEGTVAASLAQAHAALLESMHEEGVER
jgi:RNA polymerase sigma factor (sigma-70 family)